MKKGCIKILIINIVLGLMFITPAHAMGIKENSLITDNTIKLGDVFYGLNRDEDRVLGNAPRPGTEMVLNARTLLRIAIALDLPWRPSSNADKVVLKRDATIIEYPQIKEAIQTALYDEGVYGDYDIAIPTEFQRIILPADQPAQMHIERVKVDPNRNTFEVMVSAPSSDNPIYKFEVKGKMHHVIRVPVLTESLEHGRIITANDIRMMEIRERDFTKGTIADTQSLIGMTARRLVIAGRPLKETDLVAPQVVERGKLVTLNLNNGIMNISTQVKALENGAKGDIIRVVNTSSNQTLQALVTGQNAVSIVTK